MALGVSYFNTEVEDKIGLSDASQRARELNYDYQWENLGNATSQGIESEENRLTLFVGGKNIFDEVQDERHPDDAAFIYAPLYGRIVYGGIEFEF